MTNHHGQKVTTDPESTRNPIEEGVGVVTSDSLAAESLKSDGDFGAGNSKAGVSKQPSSSTNTNNTDTSSATKLDAAANAQLREERQGQSSQPSVKSSQDLGKESGVGPTYNTIGSGVNSSGVTRGVSTGSQSGADGVQGNIAPTGAYAGSGEAARDPGVMKPKGTNLTEDNDLRGKTAFGEVGTDMDPGRVAEAEFAKRDAAQAGVSKRGLAQGGDSKFSTLSSEST